MEEIKIPNQQQLSFSTFVKISILLCLVNLTIIGRLHMYDESTITAQNFYNSDIKMAGGNPNPTFSTAKFTKDTNFTSLFSQIQLQSSYLLPLTLSGSAFFVIMVFAQSILDQVHTNLMIALSVNLLCFLLLWLLPGIFIIYRLTYLIQALLIFPMLITSTLGLARITPNQINNYKVYFICLMFFLPYLGIPITYQLFDGYPYNISPTDILVSALNKVLLFGIFISFVSIYFLGQNKIQINNCIAKVPENYTLQLHELQPKQSMQISQQIIHNQSKTSQIKQTKKKSKNLTRQKLNGMMISWGITIAVASQLTTLKKYLLTNNQLKEELINGQSTKSSVFQFNIIMYTIIISLILIGLIRDRKVKILQVTILSTMIGYTALIVLFVAVNKLLTLNFQLINNCIMVSRIFMMVLIIPIVMFIEQQGTALVQGISVLFLFSWGTQLILRLILPIFDDSNKLFVLTLIALLGCFWVARNGKQFQDNDLYNQIKQQGETEKQQQSITAIPSSTKKIPIQAGTQIQKSTKMITGQKFNQQQSKPLSQQIIIFK